MPLAGSSRGAGRPLGEFAMRGIDLVRAQVDARIEVGQ